MINDLLFCLREIATKYFGEAYLYGSQLNNKNPSKDIDVMFVCNETEKPKILQDVALIQHSSRQLIHVIYVTKEDIQLNSHFKRIISNGKKL